MPHTLNEQLLLPLMAQLVLPPGWSRFCLASVFPEEHRELPEDKDVSVPSTWPCVVTEEGSVSMFPCPWPLCRSTRLWARTRTSTAAGQ